VGASVIDRLTGGDAAVGAAGRAVNPAAFRELATDLPAEYATLADSSRLRDLRATRRR